MSIMNVFLCEICAQMCIYICIYVYICVMSRGRDDNTVLHGNPCRARVALKQCLPESLRDHTFAS